MNGQYAPPVTPMDIEKRMLRLVEANIQATQWLQEAEGEHAERVAQFEIAKARAYLKTFIPEDQKGWTEGRRAAFAADSTADLRMDLAAAESKRSSARARVKAVQTEIDLVRSISASVRNSMELGS